MNLQRQTMIKEKIKDCIRVKFKSYRSKTIWDFIGGEGTYVELLDAFEQAGTELRDEIDEYFKQFN